jgi:hypothetical protein
LPLGDGGFERRSRRGVKHVEDVDSCDRWAQKKVAELLGAGGVGSKHDWGAAGLRPLQDGMLQGQYGGPFPLH